MPSENTKKIFKNVYKELNIEAVEHGVTVIETKQKEKTSKEFNVAFVGAMAIHKGSNILKDLVSKNKNPNIKIHLFGKSEDPKLMKSKGNYINHGKYTRGELPQLLINNDIDLVCIFATWPETYSYTLTESYMAQVPILTFDIGAVGERVEKDELGWIIKFNTSSSEILKKIEEISSNKEEYKNKKDNFKKYKFKELKEMQQYYDELYRGIGEIDENRVADIYKFMEYRAGVKEFEFNQYQAAYGHVVHKYEKMRSTILWKIAKKIKGAFK